MKIVFAGIIGRFPLGGVTWCSLMYLLGLRELGHDVFYIEDTCECNYDPVQNTVAAEPDYALHYIQKTLAPYGMGDSWCYVDYRGRHHGKTLEQVKKICADADLFLVLSGGCWDWRDHYLRIPKKVFVDSDPAFMQIQLSNALEKYDSDKDMRWRIDFFRTYDRLFTFGSNIGSPGNAVPTAGFQWLHTWQPIMTKSEWAPSRQQSTRSEWTTVMTWEIKSYAEIGGNKDQEFLKVLELAKRTTIPFELAINGPKEFLESHGWHCVDAMARSLDPWMYRDFIASSRGEFSVAKHTYVKTNSGWFSDRTECYLATGRPAVVQDTGFSEHLPTGQGLFAWHTADEALDAIGRVEKDYERHSQAAREVALEHFSAEKVLKDLLDRI